jgi:hypothetical protein
MSASAGLKDTNERGTEKSPYISDHRNHGYACRCRATMKKLRWHRPKRAVGGAMACWHEGERNEGENWLAQQGTADKSNAHDQAGECNMEWTFAGAI